METWHRGWLGAVGLLWIAQAAAQPPSTLQLPSCVAGSPPLTVPVDAARATLDRGDRSRFHEAAAARYPLYQRGGLVPADVLMLQRGADWLYVAVSPLGPKGPCFTAVFAAERFDFTEGWRAKYRPQPGWADL